MNLVLSNWASTREFYKMSLFINCKSEQLKGGEIRPWQDELRSNY